MDSQFNTVGFVKAVPGMFRNVWPGLWPLVIAIGLILYFTEPDHLHILPFSNWLALHLLIIGGLVSVTVWLYNTYKRPVVNMAVIGVWLLASAMCQLFDLIFGML